MFQAEEAAEVKALWGKELFSAPIRVQKKERAQEGCRGAGRNGQCPPEHQIKPEHLPGRESRGSCHPQHSLRHCLPGEY